MSIKILAFDGSGRKNSINRKVLNLVIAEAKSHGAEVTQINPHDYDLPLYNGDLESEKGIPEKVMQLKELFKSHDALLIASPEYNGSFTPLLKNFMDWVSRPVKGEPPLNCFQGKVAGIIAASGGKLGGLRGLYHLNNYLFVMGSLVLPQLVSINFFNDALDENGALKNDNDKKAVTNLGQKIVDVASRLKA